MTRACTATAYHPEIVDGIQIHEIGAGEGTLLESPDSRGHCRVSDDELLLVQSMDGSKSVMELLYRDMAHNQSMAFERVGNLLLRLKRAGLLVGQFQIRQRLEQAIESSTIHGRLCSLLRRIRFHPLVEQTAQGFFSLLARPAKILIWPPALVVLAVLSLCLPYTAHWFLLSDFSSVVDSGSKGIEGLLWVLVTILTLVSGRHLVTGAVLSRLGTPASMDIGLMAALPALRISERSCRRAGPRRLGGALAITLLLEMSLAVIVLSSAITGCDGPLRPTEGLVALAVLLLTLLDLCPFGNLLLGRCLALLSKFDDLTDRSVAFLMKRCPSRIRSRFRRVSKHEVSGQEAEGWSTAEHWYLIAGLVSLAWILGLLLVGHEVSVRFIFPLAHRLHAAPSTIVFLGEIGRLLFVALPLLLSLLASLVWLTERPISILRAFKPRIDLGLYIPVSLILCVGLTLTVSRVEDTSEHPLSFTIMALSNIACPFLALAIMKRHKNSRIGRRSRCLVGYYAFGILSLPLLLARCGLLSSLGGAKPLFFALNSTSFLLLFPFMLYSFFGPAGKWLSAFTAVVPFVLASALFGGRDGGMVAPESVGFLGVAGPAAFSGLAFLTLLVGYDTTLAAFWALMAASLTLTALSRAPELASILDRTAVENLTFTVGVSTLASLLSVASLVAHLLAFNRLELATSEETNSQETREPSLLLSGFARLVNGLVQLVSSTVGRSSSELLLRNLAGLCQVHGLPLKVSSGRELVEVSGEPPDMNLLARSLRKIALELLRGMAYLVGDDISKRGLLLAMDRIFWIERELLSYYLFRGTTLGHDSRSVAFGLSEQSRVEIVRRIPLFSLLQPDELEKIALLFRRQDVPAGQVVIHQGEEPDAFYVILAGELSVSSDDDAGRSQQLASLGPLDCFGEIALLEGSRRTATVRAVSPSVLLYLQAHQFQEMVASLPSIADRIVPLIRHGSFLSRVPLFADLPPTQMHALAIRIREERTAAGTVVIREGEEGNRFYLIRDGTLDVSRQGVPVGRLGPGEYFGEIALLTHEPRTATVTAQTDSCLLALTQEDFYAVLSSHLTLFRSIEQFAHRRLYLLRSTGARSVERMDS